MPRFLKPCFRIACFLTLALPAQAADVPAVSDLQLLHLLNRTSFGPAPGDMETVRREGVETYIEQQLHPDLLPKPEELGSRLRQLTTLDASMAELVNEYDVPQETKQRLSDDERKELNRRQNIVVVELSAAKLLRAILSPAQLQEVMTDFWFNHFNVFAEKGLDKLLIGSFERDAIRPYALGKFRDLLQATAHHPAMLVYLDNYLNTDPNSLIARGKKIGINENYARELMELHTLGVNGGYTQDDVTALAHILTGFGLGEGRSPAQHASFYFEPRRHDFTDTTLLNTRIRGGGEEEIDWTLDLLARHPSTANHIALELAQYFIADQPPKGLVDRLAATFRSSDGDIAATLKALFYAPEFWDETNRNNKFKPPFRYVASALRAANVVPPGDTKMLQGAIAQMGEPLYRCQTPNGYSNTNDQWLNSDALLKRINFAKALSAFLSTTAVSSIESDMGSTWKPNTLTIVQAAAPNLQPALLLSSPEFMYY
ncbi:MAG: DUF1800 domain-containing protein [Pseudomonadota bacterium]|nr:DUF1800 domain-containing protein [Pseudomonadota bacterium]